MGCGGRQVVHCAGFHQRLSYAPGGALTTEQIPLSARCACIGSFTGWIAPACGWRTYSITSSARARSVGGISSPSDFATLRLMINSSLFGNSTGRSAGLAPLRIFTTIGWGWYYLSTILDDYSRYTVAWKLCATIRVGDVTDTLERALVASGCNSAKVVRRQYRACLVIIPFAIPYQGAP